MSNQDTVELELQLLHETEDACLFSDGDQSGWVAKSLIKSMEENHESEEDGYLVMLPEWLATEKGFI